MIRAPRRVLSTLSSVAVLTGCATPPAPAPRVPAPTASEVPRSSGGEAIPDARVSATILRGAQTYPSSAAPRPLASSPGPVALNFPGVGVREFARAVLGDILRLPYAVSPSATGTVTLVTARPIAKSEVLPAVEEALKTAGMAIVSRDGVLTITTLTEARAQSQAVRGDQPGFGSETLSLSFASPQALKTLLDPIVPGVIASVDPTSNTLVLSGSMGQRRAVRDLVRQFDVDWLKGMSFGLYVPKNTDARLIAPELDKLINASGSPMAGRVRLIAMEKLNGIVAISTQSQYLDDVARWVEVLDREGQSSERRLFVYRVQNGRASDLSRVLASAFGRGGAVSSGGPGRGARPALDQAGVAPAAASPQLAPTNGQALPGQSPAPATSPETNTGAGDGLTFTADETNNAVVAYATPREYALIEDALRQLDVVPLQVVVEAVITEVSLNNAVRYGSQWFINSGNDRAILSRGKTADPASTYPGFTYLLNGSSIAATLDALSTVTHVEVLSAPNLMVLNNQTASLEVGDQVPISTGSALNSSSVISSIDYRDTGVLLKITPRVNSGGLVLLDIAQEVSDVSPTSSSTIDSPTISVRKIATSIAVQDGQTVALGGLIRDNNRKQRSGVPFLSAVPLLGALAGARDNARERTELLVLLTPRVVRNGAEIQAVTDDLREKIRSISPKPERILP